MVTELVKNNKKYFVCKECGLLYKKKELARKCEKWCGKYKSCNIGIIKNAVKPYKKPTSISS